jgi:hypothetical protein
VQQACGVAAELLGRQRLAEQGIAQGGGVLLQAGSNGFQVPGAVAGEEALFKTMEAAEGRILFALFVVVGAGVEAIVQFGKALRGCR